MFVVPSRVALYTPVVRQVDPGTWHNGGAIAVTAWLLLCLTRHQGPENARMLLARETLYILAPLRRLFMPVVCRYRRNTPGCLACFRQRGGADRSLLRTCIPSQVAKRRLFGKATRWIGGSVAVGTLCSRDPAKARRVQVPYAVQRLANAGYFLPASYMGKLPTRRSTKFRYCVAYTGFS
jgi:hypothetical protein